MELGQCDKCHLIKEVADTIELQRKTGLEISLPDFDKYELLCKECFERFVVREVDFLDDISVLIEEYKEKELKALWTKEYKEGYVAGLIRARELYIQVKGKDNEQ